MENEVARRESGERVYRAEPGALVKRLSGGIWAPVDVP
jgi:hypothetical protein